MDCRTGFVRSERRPTALKLLSTVTAFALGAGAYSAGAADFVVTHFTDGAGACSPESCTLRSAVLASNALGGGDRILLQAGSHTLSIAGDDETGFSGDLDVRGDLEIVGAGTESTVISANTVDRVLEVWGSVGGELTLRHLTVKGGLTSSVLGGGGIRIAAGRLTLDHVAVTQNAVRTFDFNLGSTNGGGGISAYSSLIQIVDSEVSNNLVVDESIPAPVANGGGGGIRLNGLNFVEIERSTVSGNRASNGSGGGIVIGATPVAACCDDDQVTILDSTINGNYAHETGGGIHAVRTGNSILERSTLFDNRADLSGGAIQVEEEGELKIVNSTITRNSAGVGGGGGFALGGVHLENVTIHENLAAFFAGFAPSASSTYKSSIFSGGCNPGEVGVSLGGNIESPGDTCGLDRPSDQVNVPSFELLLSDLASHGGFARTRVPQPGSAARDSGVDDDDGCPAPAVDQRGVARPLNGDGIGDAKCDVGAVETLQTERGALFADGFEHWLVFTPTGRWSMVVGD